MTTTNDDPWLERRARLAETLAAEHAKLGAQRDAATAPHLALVPSGPGDPESGAREPNAGQPALLAAIERANKAGNVREVLRLNNQMLGEISRAARTDEQPDFSRTPLDAA